MTNLCSLNAFKYAINLKLQLIYQRNVYIWKRTFHIYYHCNTNYTPFIMRMFCEAAWGATWLLLWYSWLVIRIPKPPLLFWKLLCHNPWSFSSKFIGPCDLHLVTFCSIIHVHLCSIWQTDNVEVENKGNYGKTIKFH